MCVWGGMCMCVRWMSNQTNPTFICCGRSVCVIFTRGFGKLTGSLVLVFVLVQLVLFMGADGVGALAQQQNSDTVVCSLLQQYHHSLPAAPWAESGDNKCTENCFLGAWNEMLLIKRCKNCVFYFVLCDNAQLWNPGSAAIQSLSNAAHRLKKNTN